jgi:16S rRNA processing protein RimM
MQTEQKNSNLISVAKIMAPFGIKGLAKIKSFMSNPVEIFQHVLFDEENKEYKFTLINELPKGLFIVKINNISNRTEIETFGKRTFYINRSELPEADEDEFYISDLKQLPILDENSLQVGCVNEIYNFGAGDILEIKFLDGKKVFYPFNKACFPTITKEHITFIASNYIQEDALDNKNQEEPPESE